MSLSIGVHDNWSWISTYTKIGGGFRCDALTIIDDIASWHVLMTETDGIVSYPLKITFYFHF